MQTTGPPHCTLPTAVRAQCGAGRRPRGRRRRQCAARETAPPAASAAQDADVDSDDGAEGGGGDLCPQQIHDAGCAFEEALARHSTGAEPRSARAQIKAAVDALLDDEDKRAGMSPLCHAAWAAHLPRVREIAPLAGPERDAAVAASQTSDALLQERREAALQFWRERKRVTASEWKAPPGTPLPRSTGGERGRARHAMRSYHGMCAPSLGLTRTCCFWSK